ncbi:MAG: M1 family metallopeptidase [Flavobacteriaceae bacterium]|nr:M1 family metallopeptidase [Flavobacteriaceae bacterium]
MRKTISLIFGILAAVGFSQQQPYVDFIQAEVKVTINPDKQEVFGSVDYRFDVLKSSDSIFLDARNMTIEEVFLNNKPVDFNYQGRQLIIKNNLRPESNHKLRVSFRTKPSKAMYFRGWNNEAPDEVWTQGQGKYTSSWLPSLDDMNDKIEFDLSIMAPKDYAVVANGKYVEGGYIDDMQRWEYNMDLPMSSYLVALAIGRYDKRMIYSNSGIPIELYYRSSDSIKFEPTYRYTKEIFDFLENEIGLAYPWQNYKQIPIHDFLYAGMENTGATFFSDDFMIDEIAFNDNSYVNVNAHELAHQWFGNMVTETSGVHHWLHEGFASYYALLAEQHLFGDSHFYMKLYKSALKLEEQDLAGNGTSLLNPKSNSLTFYEKGAWTLFMLRELVGDHVFKSSIKEYLNAYKFKNVETDDFMDMVEKIADTDLTAFEKQWLLSDDFPIERAIDALNQMSPYVQGYINTNCEVEQSKCAEILSDTFNDDIKIKIITEQPDLINPDLFDESWKVRQAVALNSKSIADNDRELYESLLDDPSYITREAALYKLWTFLPDKRMVYLERTKDIFGLSDGNVRLLWLVLAMNTSGFDQDSIKQFYSELLEYTTDIHNPSLRIRAFNYLAMLDMCLDECQSNLELAKQHYNWQLSKFARQELAKLKD